MLLKITMCFHFHGILYFVIHAHVYYGNFAGLSYFKMEYKHEIHQDYMRITLAKIRAFAS